MNSEEDYKTLSMRSFNSSNLDSIFPSEQVSEVIEQIKEKNLKYGPEGNRIRIYSPMSDYMEYGPAYPQFFWFIRLNLFLLCFCDGIFVAILSARGEFNTFFEGSTGFAGISHETKKLLSVIWNCMGVAFALFGLLAAYLTRNLGQTTKLFPPDFTVEMRNLPEDTTEEDIRKFVLEHCSGAQISKIVLVEEHPDVHPEKRNRFTGKAFVTFDYQKDRDTVLKVFGADKNIISRMLTSDIKLGNKKIYAFAPGDVDDVIPENYGYLSSELFSQRITAYAWIVLAIIGCLIGQYICKLIIKPTAPKILTSISILIFNGLALNFAAGHLEKIKFSSHTLRRAEMAWSAASLHFINIVFIPLVVNFIYYRSTGDVINEDLVREVASNSLFQSTFPFVLSLLNLKFLIKSLKNCCKRKKILSTSQSYRTLQEHYLHDEFDLSANYGRVMAILMFTFFVGFFLPAAFVCATVGILIGDYAIRLQFARQSRRPERRGSDSLARKVNFIFFVYPFLMYLGIFFFIRRFIDNDVDPATDTMNNAFLIAGIGMLILGAVLGERIFRVLVLKPHQNISYKEAAQQYPKEFEVDYEELFASKNEKDTSGISVI